MIFPGNEWFEGGTERRFSTPVLMPPFAGAAPPACFMATAIPLLRRGVTLVAVYVPPLLTTLADRIVLQLLEPFAMSNPNPFASPQSAPGYGGGPEMGGGFSPRTATILSQTRGWIIFRAVLWYIIAALLVLALVAAGNFLQEIPQLNALGGLVMVGIVIFLGYFLIEAILLTVVAARLGGYLRSGNPSEMTTGMKILKVFWIVEGSLALVFTIFALIGTFMSL